MNSLLVGRAACAWIAVGLLALLAACGGGGDGSGADPSASPPAAGEPAPSGPTSDATPPQVTDFGAQATALAAQIVDSASAAPAVEATRQALASGGLRVSGGAMPALAPRPPAASWDVDQGIAFNLAAEAHDRALSGRLTLAELGRMWADFEFPFAGTGTPGEQLMAFLRESLLAARAAPGDPNSFAPLFIAEMAKRQSPAVDVADTAVRPEDLRLSLLEIELLHALFDRAFTVDATADPAAATQRRHTLAASDGLCAELKAFYGKIGGKLVEKGIKLTAGAISDKALSAIGMTAAEIKLFGTYGKMFGALGSALKVVKMVQIYAAGQATLTVEGPNPIMRPPFKGPRTLVPVTATAGASDADWQAYQQNNGSEAYQSVKSCLGSIGAPIPLDLKDIAKNADKWRLAWELTSGSPKHAFITTDVNDFNASSAGNPFGMKLVSAGVASATATLKVDLREESQLATLFQGPLQTANVRVRARVFTAEPPSPLIIAQVTSLMGTISALVDISVGWVQTMIPPTSSIAVKVQYHDVPQSIDATFALSMVYDYPHFRGVTDVDRHTVSGTWSALLSRTVIRQGDDAYDFYSGSGAFNYGGVSTRTRIDDAGCQLAYSYEQRNGNFQMNLGPTTSMNGTVLPEDPELVALGGGDVAPSSWPSERKTLTISCPDSDPQRVEFQWLQEIFVAAANAMNLQDASLAAAGVSLPGMYLNRGRLLSDGSIELSYTTPKTVSVIAPGVPILETTIVSQHNLIRLRPIYAPPAP